MTPTTLVTGADAAYFPLLKGCLRSLRERARDHGYAVSVLDLGLSAAQRGWVESMADRVVEPGWDFDFPGRDGMPGWFRAMTARPFLPRHFPGHEIYLWIDSDAWVQDWAAISLYIRAAGTGALAITPEIDRAYRHFYKAGAEFRGVNGAAYREAFGGAEAAELIHYPLLNSGALALAADAPHWAQWAETLGAALQRSRNMLVEQAALNWVIYRRDLPVRMLPSWCNWICHHALPAWDEAAACFVEPSLPHHRLGILHLTLDTKRTDRHDIAVIDGAGAVTGRRAMPLRYPGRAEASEAAHQAAGLAPAAAR